MHHPRRVNADIIITSITELGISNIKGLIRSIRDHLYRSIRVHWDIYLAKCAENARAKASPLLLASSVPPSLATAYECTTKNWILIEDNTSKEILTINLYLVNKIRQMFRQHSKPIPMIQTIKSTISVRDILMVEALDILVEKPSNKRFRSMWLTLAHQGLINQ